MKQLLTKTLPLFALLLSGITYGQTPFWTEDFAGGIPSSWSNADESGQNAIWTWCNNPGAGNGQAGCPSIWDDGGNQQMPFAAATASNGFASVDSDEYGDLPANHVSQLTTPAIDCSGKSAVYVTFQTHIGVFTIPADNGAVLRVSTDNMNWTEYQIFTGVENDGSFASRWSQNPFIPIIDITTQAAGNATVYLQWQWTGRYEYHWNLDDIAIYDENPLPRHDLVLGDYFYAPSSLAQPASQITTDTFSFGADISNAGSMEQTNVILRASVTTDTDEEIFADSLVIPAIASGVVDSFFELPGRFAPELPVGSYKIKYELRADSADLRPADNSDFSRFYATDNVFSKENGPASAGRPNSGGDYVIANLYRMGEGSLDKYQATLAQISHATDDNELPITSVVADIYLFRVNDTVDVEFNNFDVADIVSASTEWLGVGSYVAADTADQYDVHTVELLDLASGLPGIPLDNGARYLLGVSYSGANNLAFHAYSDEVNMFFVSTILYTNEWNPAGFGPDFNAVIRMAISLISTTDDKPLPESAMKIFPNPTRETLNLTVDFDQPTDATITIADLTGRVIIVQDREGLLNDNLTYQLPQLASGTYLARIATAEGTLTKKFMVQK